MALSDNERAAVLRHLGYPVLNRGVAIGFGVAYVAETSRYIEAALLEIHPDAEADVRQLISELDEIECQKQALAKTMGTVRVEGVVFAGSDGLFGLQMLKKDKAHQLADLFGGYVNPYSNLANDGLGSMVREGGC